MTQRYTAEEAQKMLNRWECRKKGGHVTWFRLGSPFGIGPSPFEVEWRDDASAVCINCDALVSVEYPTLGEAL